jgi:hypothetical protein
VRSCVWNALARNCVDCSVGVLGVVRGELPQSRGLHREDYLAIREPVAPPGDRSSIHFQQASEEVGKCAWVTSDLVVST